MRPILEGNKKKSTRNIYLIIFYCLIFIICIVGIAYAVYSDFYKGQIDFIPSNSNTYEESEEKDRYNELKGEFSSIFTNQLEKYQEELSEIVKISNDYDIIVTAYKYEKNEENCNLSAYIPYINIKREIPVRINKKIGEQFREKAEKINNSNITEKTIYSVTYIAYLQNDILSLVIRGELKEGTKSQKIEVKTFNYNIKEDKEVTLNELLESKSIHIQEVNKKIKEEIKEIQKENESLEQILSGDGEFYKRDYNSDIYTVEKTEEYFLGKEGLIYLIYAYGNKDYTSEMDIVILK